MKVWKKGEYKLYTSFDSLSKGFLRSRRIQYFDDPLDALCWIQKRKDGAPGGMDGFRAAISAIRMNPSRLNHMCPSRRKAQAKYAKIPRKQKLKQLESFGGTRVVFKGKYNPYVKRKMQKAPGDVASYLRLAQDAVDGKMGVPMNLEFRFFDQEAE